jgi:hypothetical protein
LAGGTGHLIGELLGLLLGELFESAFGQPGGGSGSDLLHLIKIDVEAWSRTPVGVACDDFAPLLGEFLHSSELLR